MHLLVIGATGPSGVAFINEALKAGHEITIYARNPRKLSWEVLKNSSVHVVEGTFEDIEAVRPAVTGGAEVLVSLAGPVVGNWGKGTPIRDFYEGVYSLIQSEPSCRIRRCLILSTASFPSREDAFSWRWWFVVLFIKTLANFAYQEIVTSSGITAAQPVDALNWTIFRVPILTNGSARPVQVGFKGNGKDGLILSRKSLALWLLQELDSGKWVGEAPMVSHRRWL